jgi:hypothetical protein
MVLKKHIGIIFKPLIFILLAISFSCEELPYYFVNCEDNTCTINKPVNTELRIELDKTGTIVLVDIYEGVVEDSILYDSFYTRSSFIYRTVALNKTYTVTATYIYDDISYVSINSIRPSVRFVRDMCEEPCYHVYNKVVNLRLKYTE